MPTGRTTTTAAALAGGHRGRQPRLTTGRVRARPDPTTPTRARGAGVSGCCVRARLRSAATNPSWRRSAAGTRSAGTAPFRVLARTRPSPWSTTRRRRAFGVRGGSPRSTSLRHTPRLPRRSHQARAASTSDRPPRGAKGLRARPPLSLLSASPLGAPPAWHVPPDAAAAKSARAPRRNIREVPRPWRRRRAGRRRRPRLLGGGRARRRRSRGQGCTRARSRWTTRSRRGRTA